MFEICMTRCFLYNLQKDQIQTPTLNMFPLRRLSYEFLQLVNLLLYEFLALLFSYRSYYPDAYREKDGLDLRSADYRIYEARLTQVLREQFRKLTHTLRELPISFRQSNGLSRNQYFHFFVCQRVSRSISNTLFPLRIDLLSTKKQQFARFWSNNVSLTIRDISASDLHKIYSCTNDEQTLLQKYHRKLFRKKPSEQLVTYFPSEIGDFSLILFSKPNRNLLLWMYQLLTKSVQYLLGYTLGALSILSYRIGGVLCLGGSYPCEAFHYYSTVGLK